MSYAILENLSTVELLSLTDYWKPNQDVAQEIRKRLKAEPWRLDAFLPYLIKCNEQAERLAEIQNRKPLI